MVYPELCFLCLSQEDTAQCNQCKNVVACNQHIKNHKSSQGTCFPFRVEQTSETGRNLVATRNIKQGETILVEFPEVVGPYTRSKAQCLNCFKLIDNNSKTDCVECRFPVCNEECARGRNHEDECELFKSVGFQAVVDSDKEDEFDPQYSAVTVLRLLRAMDREEEMQSVDSNNNMEEFRNNTGMIGTLMDHNEDRETENKDIWAYETKFILKFIQQCKLGQRYPDERIRKAAGILATNGLSLELPATGYGRGVAIFPIYIMMNHSCMSNTQTFNHEDSSLQVVSQVDIDAGQEITTQYIDTDKPTMIRRQMLQQKWFFNCQCPRCSDPTECGSNMSTLLCLETSCDGSVVPSNPLDDISNWECMKCGAMKCLEDVQSLLERATQQIGNPPHGSESLFDHYEEVLCFLSLIFHPHHHLIMYVKQKLAMMYGNTDPFCMWDMDRSAKQRKVQLCMDVIDGMAQSVSKTLQTTIMLELTKAKVAIAREDFSTGQLSEEGLQAALLQNKAMLRYLATLTEKTY